MATRNRGRQPRSAKRAILSLSRACGEMLPRIHHMGTMLFDPVWAERTHTSSDSELLHVIRGSVKLELGDAVLPAGPGDTLCVPPKTLHRDRFDLDRGLEVFFCSFSWPWVPSDFGTTGNRAVLALPEPRKAELGVLFHQLAMDRGGLSEAGRLASHGRLLAILALLLRAAGSPGEESARAESKPALAPARRRVLMREAKHYLERNYARPLTLDGIAAALRVSPYHLSHVFSAHSDFSLFAELTLLRMNQACMLLQDRRLSVAEVARAVGYKDPNYFAKVFRKHAGRAPRDYAIVARRRG